MATAQKGLVGLLEQAHQALAAVAQELDALPQLSAPDLLSATELAASVSRLSEVAMVRTVHAVEEQDRRAMPGESLACQHGLRDAATLVMTLTGASRRTLKRWREVAGATALRGFGSTGVLPPLLPQMAAAFATGALGLDQALVIRQHLLAAATRARPEDVDAAERALVAAAIGASDEVPDAESDDDTAHADVDAGSQLPLTPELLGVQARAWRDAIDPDGPEPSYEQQREQRSFTLGRRADGMWVGKMLLPPEQGEALRLALHAHNAPRTPIRFDEGATTPAHGDGLAENGPDGAADGRAHGDPDDDAQGRAGGDSLAASGAYESPSVTGTGLARQGHRDERTTAQRQADTLVGLITRAMEASDAPRIGGDSATVVVTISDAELAEHARSGGGTAYLQDSDETIPAHVAARLMCDGYIQACVLDDDGLPLHLGRARRSHTRHQRKAILTAYPGGCQNPGCAAPTCFTEIHHPIWWSQGGETSTDNGVPLCQHCHILVHTGQLRCERDASGRWYVVPTLRLRGRRAA